VLVGGGGGNFTWTSPPPTKGEWCGVCGVGVVDGSGGVRELWREGARDGKGGNRSGGRG